MCDCALLTSIGTIYQLPTSASCADIVSGHKHGASGDAPVEQVQISEIDDSESSASLSNPSQNQVKAKEKKKQAMTPCTRLLHRSQGFCSHSCAQQQGHATRASTSYMAYNSYCNGRYVPGALGCPLEATEIFTANQIIGKQQHSLPHTHARTCTYRCMRTRIYRHTSMRIYRQA
jgi:hypothetical protein